MRRDFYRRLQLLSLRRDRHRYGFHRAGALSRTAQPIFADPIAIRVLTGDAAGTDVPVNLLALANDAIKEPAKEAIPGISAKKSRQAGPGASPEAMIHVLPGV